MLPTKTHLPQIIIVCDFARFRVQRLATGENVEFKLADLHKNIKLFGFIAGYKAQVIQPQNPVNIKAAERVAFLFELYQRLTSLLPADAAKPKRRVKTA